MASVFGMPADLQDLLTSADRQQAIRIQVTPDSSGKATIVFPKPYASGIKAVVSLTAETPANAAYRNDAGVDEGTATNTSVGVIVQRMSKSFTVSVLGSVLQVLTPVTTPVWLNVFIRASAT